MINHKPFFSVIVPLYNKEKYLYRSLGSIQKQTYTNYEVIIVNDGSTDGSLCEAQKYLASNWQIYSQKNSGVSAARNKGAELATGKLLCFIDGDDEWLPGYLAEMAELVKRYPDAGMWGASYMIISDKKTVIIHRRHGRRRCNLFKEFIIGQPFHTSGHIIRKSAFIETGGYNLANTYFEDVELMFKVALRYEVATTSSRQTFYYISVEESLTKQLAKTDLDYPCYYGVIECALAKGHSDWWFNLYARIAILRLLSAKAVKRDAAGIAKIRRSLPLSFARAPFRSVFGGNKVGMITFGLAHVVMFLNKCLIRPFLKVKQNKRVIKAN